MKIIGIKQQRGFYKHIEREKNSGYKRKKKETIINTGTD